jgi:hypothetical protein
VELAEVNAWFGTDWGSPICQHTPQVAVPIGQRCLWCDEPIAADDNGVVMPYMESVGNVFVTSQAALHIECHVRQFVGSVGHQLGLCTCEGGAGCYEGEPATMSVRDAARAAWDLARQRARAR